MSTTSRTSTGTWGRSHFAPGARQDEETLGEVLDAPGVAPDGASHRWPGSSTSCAGSSTNPRNFVRGVLSS